MCSTKWPIKKSWPKFLTSRLCIRGYQNQSCKNPGSFRSQVKIDQISPSRVKGPFFHHLTVKVAHNFFPPPIWCYMMLYAGLQWCMVDWFTLAWGFVIFGHFWWGRHFYKKMKKKRLSVNFSFFFLDGWQALVPSCSKPVSKVLGEVGKGPGEPGFGDP